MDVFDLLTNRLNDEATLNQLGGAVGADPQQVQQLAQVGLPVLLQALGRNASTPDGATSLSRALDQHQGEDLGDLGGFLTNANTEDGAAILQHIFPGNTQAVQTRLANQTGLDVNQVVALMTRFAPLVLAALGQQKQQANLNDGGVADLVSTLGQMFGPAATGGTPPGVGSQTAQRQQTGGGLLDVLRNILGGGR